MPGDREAAIPTGDDKATRSRSVSVKPGREPARPASNSTDIANFLTAARMIVPLPGAGRLIFALDATMSRQPAWDTACALQGGMFEEAAKAGGLSVQLVYFRGLGECRSSKFVRDARALGDIMSRIDCRGGHTQIARVLRHAANEAREKPVSALVFIGDAMEENPDELCALAGELALRKVPAFVFQEGHDPRAGAVFAEIARITGGAHLPFDRTSAGRLAELLKAIAAFASGGLPALEKSSGAGARLLLSHMGGRSGNGGGRRS